MPSCKRSYFAIVLLEHGYDSEKKDFYCAEFSACQLCCVYSQNKDYGNPPCTLF